MRYSPDANHPEQRLLDVGASALSDAELLSVLLSSDRQGCRHCSTEDARAFLTTLDNLASLLRPELREYQEHFGKRAGERHVITLRASAELARRLVLVRLRGHDVLKSPEDVRRFLSLHMVGRQHEVFAALFLDNRHRVICYRELFEGTIDSAAVYPREIVKQALQLNAATLIFCHNHPSGNPEPTDTDVRLTRKLVDALALIDVRVTEHSSEFDRI